MLSLELNFYPREDASGDEFDQFDEQLMSFVGCLARNGNVVGDYEPVKLEDCVQVRVYCLAPDALDELNLSEWARGTLETLKTLSFKEPEFRAVHTEKI